MLTVRVLSFSAGGGGANEWDLGAIGRRLPWNRTVCPGPGISEPGYWHGMTGGTLVPARGSGRSACCGRRATGALQPDLWLARRYGTARRLYGGITTALDMGA